MNDLIKTAYKYLYMNWLRPESVVWHTIAHQLISKKLLAQENILELGVGNGYNSFMLLNGEFSKDYDSYYNVNIDGFWNNSDIYNSINNEVNINKYIYKKTHKNLKLAIDHKENLISQASQLNFIDKIVNHDANNEFTFSGIDTVYSNILYWLDDPFEVLNNISRFLKEKSKIFIVFPNQNFFNYCPSYNSSSQLWKLINRGRSQTMMWHMDIGEFEKNLRRRNSNLSIIHHQTYLSKQTLNTYDVGLRPLSPHLIKMANLLEPKYRLEIKEEWCSTCMKFLDVLLEGELEDGVKSGGFNFVVLEKNQS